MDQVCANCIHYQHEDITDGWICVNPDSGHTADWVERDDTCDEWFPKQFDNMTGSMNL